MLILFISPEPVSADEDLINDTYQGVPYRITSNQELIIGKEGAEYTVNCADLIASIPGLQDNKGKAAIHTVHFAGILHQDGSCESMLKGFSGMRVLNLDGLETSGATDMNHMFSGCSSVNQINVSQFDTSNVTSMKGMFKDCENLYYLDLSGFDTSKVTDIQYMFDGCKWLYSLDLSKFDTRNVTSLKAMFQDCNRLKSLNLSGFDTSKVTDMGFMFNSCDSLAQLNLAHFNTSKVTNMRAMFQGCDALMQLDLSGFDTGAVQDMSGIFRNCKGLRIIALGSKTLFSSDPPVRGWSRYQKLNGDAVKGPSITNLTDYDVKYPGWYTRGNVPSPEEPDDLVTDLSEEISVGDPLKVILRTMIDPGTGTAPAKADCSWTQSGTGQVRETSSTNTDPAWHFEMVRAGSVVITFKSNDGTWSDSLAFWIHDPSVTVRDDVTIGPGGSREKLKNGGSCFIDFDVVPDLSKAKKYNYFYYCLDQEFSGISSDESIAIPGTVYGYYDTSSDDNNIECQCYLPLKLRKAGKVTIWLIDKASGEPADSITMKISEKTVKNFNKAWEERACAQVLQYGETTLRLDTYVYCEGDQVTLNFGGEKQTKTISKTGITKFDVPVKKTGSKGTITFRRSYDSHTVTHTVKVKDTDVGLVVDRVRPASKKISIEFYNDYGGSGYVVTRKGDYLKIKVGKKTYTKKFGDNPKRFYTQKIKKQKRGTKIKITLYNKFGQVRTSTTLKVK